MDDRNTAVVSRLFGGDSKRMTSHSERWTLYGVPGWGSVLAEAMLTRAKAPIDFIDVEGFDKPSPARDELLGVNPLAQVPTLITPEGALMTESAAITLLLSETFPEAHLAPEPGDVDRPRFLRWLVWMVSAVYPTFTFADYPERWAPSAKNELYASVETHRQKLWRIFDAELTRAPWQDIEHSALGIYLCAMTRWRPRRAWFEAECPAIARLAHAVDQQGDLIPVWKRNFPDA